VTREQFLAFVARLGRVAAAKRLGVHPQTITRWKRDGLPDVSRSDRAKRASRVVARAERSHRAAQTRARSRTWADEAREHITLPPKQRPYERLTPDQVLPTRDPLTDPRVKSLLKETGRPSEGWKRFENEHHVGEYAWFDLPPHTDFHSLDLEALRTHVEQAYLQSGRVYCRFLAIYAYAYADNPAYQGRLAHLKELAHRWKASVTTNRIASGRDGARALVDFAFSREPKRMAPGARRGGYSVETQAETRVIYVLRYMISTFDRLREQRETDFLE
jgi:hypothetical protein